MKKRRKIHLLPKTNSGKWSLWLILTFILLLIFTIFLIASGQRGSEKFSDNLILSIPTLIAGLSAIASFFTGIISIIKHKERSILIYPSTIIGFLVLFFVLGELIFPH